MSEKKHLHYISVIICLAVLICTCTVSCGASSEALPGYETRLFDSSRVHTIDLIVEDWGEFIKNAPEEEYVSCTAVIDGEKFEHVGLRAKGNNSLRQTEKYELSRYSLKIEFDKYIDGYTYYGLDKFSLDSSFQDNSYMKTFLVYDMMDYMGVVAPLCSYVNVTVNGKPWGLFLAIEEPEESFAIRNWGRYHGQLYKPDYKSLNADNADVDLRYIDDNPDSYDNIFRKAKFPVTYEAKMRLIKSLHTLSTGENIESVINVDAVLRYLATQVFVMNMDSMLGPTGHNYFLYEKDGMLSVLPWDYNLAFGTYCLGMSEPIKESNVIINYPVDTPWDGEVMRNRPLYHNLMQNDDYFAQYHDYIDMLLCEYMESGHCEAFIHSTAEMIAPYVENDASAFCTYEDHLVAIDTLIDVCEFRTQSIRGQLDGKYPSTFREQEESPDAFVDAGSIDLFALGDFDDLENAKERQDAAVNAVIG